METTIAGEGQDTELPAMEPERNAARRVNSAPNLPVVARGQALTGRRRRHERAALNGDSAITLYLCEVGRVKRLTPREEIQTIARTKRGDRKARERLIKSNLRRVVEISREYENVRLPLLDLISEGNLGLMEAVERFEPTRGNTFATFSTRWIRQSIRRALAHEP